MTGSERRSMSLETPWGPALSIISARTSSTTLENQPPSRFLSFSFSVYLHALVLILFNKIVESSELCLWFFDMITCQSSSNKITKYTKPSKLIHLSNWQFLVKKTFRHADGGFESVPMADTEENGHPAK